MTAGAVPAGAGRDGGEGRRVPVNGSRRETGKTLTVSWAEHEEAWQEYSRHYTQSAERIAERGGFSLGELRLYLGRYPETLQERAQ